MGRERIRARKYLYFFVASIMVLALSGCAAFREMGTKRDADDHLAAAKKLFDQGDYEGALKEDGKVLTLSPDAPPGDQALFHEGLIYAHYGNRKRDNRKAMECFRKLTKTFPRSPLAIEARTWIGVLQENERLKKEAHDLAGALRKSKQVDIEVDEKMKGLTK